MRFVYTCTYLHVTAVVMKFAVRSIPSHSAASGVGDTGSTAHAHRRSGQCSEVVAVATGVRSEGRVAYRVWTIGVLKRLYVVHKYVLFLKKP